MGGVQALGQRTTVSVLRMTCSLTLMEMGRIGGEHIKRRWGTPDISYSTHGGRGKLKNGGAEKLTKETCAWKEIKNGKVGKR